MENLVTVIGMLLAFIAAFFAEPVKRFFDNKSKIQQLRKALYKELLHNYTKLRIFSEDTGYLNKEYIELINTNILSTECYKQIKQNDSVLFFQLPESIVIDAQYSCLSWLNPYNAIEKKSADKEKTYINTFLHFANTFLSGLIESFYLGELRKEVLKEITTPKQYQMIMEKGKKEAEKESSESKT
jgi:hypothetical protein